MNKIQTVGTFRFAEKQGRGDKLIFVFTAMGTKIGVYRPFLKLLNLRGFSYVVYDYSLSVVHSGDFELWEQHFYELIEHSQGKLGEYEKRGATKIYSYGISMGTLMANRLARETPQISHVVLNLTYGDIADNIWVYRGVSKAKESVIARGLSKEDLRRAVKYIDPIYNAESLRGKKVMLFLARRDKVLLNEQTQFTKKAFEDAGLDMVYVENKYLGHFTAGSKNMFQIRRLEKFFNS